MPSTRLTARIPTTPEVRDDLAAARDATPEVDDYDTLLRIMLSEWDGIEGNETGRKRD